MYGTNVKSKEYILIITLKMLLFQMKNYLCNPDKFRQIGSLLDKRERMNPNIQGSAMRNWMKFVLHVKICKRNAYIF